MKYANFADIKLEIDRARDDERDERNAARECTIFMTKKNGQWEDGVWNKFDNLPRYSFDRTTPVIDMIVGELESNEFYATVEPSDGLATQEGAELLDGMLRAIQNQSDASFIYKRVARKLTETGFDCVEIVHDYVNEDAFEQELQIKYITNSIDRVWFDPNSENQDGSDAEWVVVFQALTPAAAEEFQKKHGLERNLVSFDSDRSVDNYVESKREVIIVGRMLYKKYTTKTLLQMSNGQVFEEDKAKSIIDDLALKGVTISKTRKRQVCQVFSRFIDGQDWIGDEKPTAFRMLPIVPFYHGFDIVEDKKVWFRIVEKLMDPQRVYNYSESRQIGMGALAPVKKIVVSPEQVAGHEAKLRTLNNNADPLLVLNSVQGQAPAYEIGGPQIDQSLMAISQSAAQNIEAISGMYGATLAKNPGIQSGRAINLQIEQSNTGNSSIFVDLAKGVTQISRVLIDTASQVYDTHRNVKVAYEDGSSEFKAINEKVLDQKTGQWVTLNDLSKGSYTASCAIGPMFRNRAEKSQGAMLDMYKVMPELAQTTADIFTKTINAPGMKAVSERIRAKLVADGEIPEDQLTDNEKEKIQQAQIAQQQNQQPDMLSQLATMQVENERLKTEIDAMLKDKQALKYDADARLANAKAEEQELKNDVLEAQVIGNAAQGIV